MRQRFVAQAGSGQIWRFFAAEIVENIFPRYGHLKILLI